MAKKGMSNDYANKLLLDILRKAKEAFDSKLSLYKQFLLRIFLQLLAMSVLHAYLFSFSWMRGKDGWLCSFFVMLFIFILYLFEYFFFLKPP